jgi:hypothetical protein
MVVVDLTGNIILIKLITIRDESESGKKGEVSKTPLFGTIKRE